MDNLPVLKWLHSHVTHVNEGGPSQTGTVLGNILAAVKQLVVLMCILTFQCISQNMIDWAWSRWPKRCWPKVYLLTLNLLSDLSCHQALWKISQNNRWSVASSTSNPTIATLATASAWAVVSEMSRKRLEESFKLLAIEVGISGTKENRG